MKRLSFSLALVLGSLCGLSHAALPKIGFYKSLYSSSQGAYTCAKVLDNTGTVNAFGKRINYFQYQREDGVVLNCVPKMFTDTDDTTSDGDPEGPIAASGAIAMCTTADSKVNVVVEFDGTHVFWGGESMAKLRLPDGTTVLGLQKERQTNYATWVSSSACP